ncbi:MAG TPA: dihydrofolate reductase family protein [Acidimicrobiales bacterium]
MRLVVINHVTLDGVMQGPGHPDEDTRDGFDLGGWAADGSEAPDPVVGRAMGARMAQSDGLVLGRRSYEQMLGAWNERGGPFKDALNNARKYVASTTLSEPLPWPNSTLLGPDVVAAVGELRARPGRELHIMGSGELIGTLMQHGLVDELLLLVHPLVLGRGRRLFTAGAPTSLELVEATPAPSGVLVATYRAAGPYTPSVSRNADTTAL